MSLITNVNRIMFATVIILFTLTEAKAQDALVVDNSGLSKYVPTSGSSRSFCQDVTIEIDGQFITISTTLTICCNTEHFICFPIFPKKEQAAQRKDQNSVTVIRSDTFTWGTHQVSVKPGNYSINSDGQITDLQYVVQKK